MMQSTAGSSLDESQKRSKGKIASSSCFSVSSTKDFRLISQCRSAKTRCCGNPPETCERCLKKRRQCMWPKEDGRTTRFRASTPVPREASSRSPTDRPLAGSNLGSDHEDALTRSLDKRPQPEDAQSNTGEPSTGLASIQGTGFGTSPVVGPGQMQSGGMAFLNSGDDSQNCSFTPFTDLLRRSNAQAWDGIPSQTSDTQISWPIRKASLDFR